MQMLPQSFRPLDHIRRVMHDEALTSTQRLILVAAVMCTDNNTGRVRASQELIADTAHVGHATVERALKVPAVRRYFVMEKKGRRLNLTWRKSLNESEIPLTMREYIPHSEGPSASYLLPSSARAAVLQTRWWENTPEPASPDAIEPDPWDCDLPVDDPHNDVPPF